MPPAEWPRRYGQLFDQAAEEYDKVRPTYPPALVDLAIERGGLGSASRVVEVGCGTGKLTELLAERGLQVDAVDPGPNMIDVARRRVGQDASVEFHVGRFEDVELPLGAFDAAFSATAFHWVEPKVGWRKAALLLEPGGLLALLTHIVVRDEESAAAHEALLDVLREHEPQLARFWHEVRQLDTVLAGVPARSGNASATWDWVMNDGQHGLKVEEAADLFEDVQVATETRTVRETADELVEHFRTTSLCQQLEPARREALLAADRRVVEEFGGTISSTFAAVLMTARRQ
ncbi:MAG TPA: class I SAM-dependent methyltransferase [Gaiellaceae bacterium]|jgi:SAM-dependent methyltransferase|nr:class I SAM-dependent methyltransferase [Gaiellaceae bacterium]